MGDSCRDERQGTGVCALQAGRTELHRSSENAGHVQVRMLSDAAENQALPDDADVGGIMKDVRRWELFCRLFCLLCRTIHGITNSPKQPDFCIRKSLLNNLRIFVKQC